MSESPTTAGWYADPLGRHEHRYFDGAQWTASVADQGVQQTDVVQVGGAQPSAVREPGAGAVPFNSGVFIWGAVSVALLAVGSLGPWATLGALSVSGTSGGRDGIVTLILAGVAALVLVIARRWVWGVLIPGVLALLTCIYDIADISSRGNELISPSPGWGLILAAFASASLCIWPFVARNYRQGG